MNIIFPNQEHEALYNEFLARMRCDDAYHRAAAYLISLDLQLRTVPDLVFDFANDAIRPEALDGAFQTQSSLRTTKLLFNLWNGWCNEAEYDADGRFLQCGDLAPGYTLYDLLGMSYNEFYIEAIKIRFLT